MQNSTISPNLHLQEQDDVKIPPMISLHKQAPAFLSTPLEIRLQIYNLCFFQDIQKYSTRTRKTVSGDCWKGGYRNKFREFDLLLVNHQIHDEAASLAYTAQRHQLIQSHQTYYLTPTQINHKPSKKWTWELESQWVWQPSCRSAKALAALRLPKLGLAFRDPQRTGVYATCTPKENLVTEEQVDALKTFFRSLVYHVRQENATKSIDIHLEGHNHDLLNCVFRASEDLLESRCFIRSRGTQYELTFISDNLPFVVHGRAMMRNMGAKARMLHPMEAPEGVGRRMPEDSISGFSWRIGVRGGWIDLGAAPQ